MSDEITDIEIFPSTIETPTIKRKKLSKKSLAKRQKLKEEQGFTGQEINIMKAHLMNPDATRLEKARAAGLVGKDETIANKVSYALERVKEKTSNNLRLQELLALKNAGVNKIAEVVADAMNAEQAFRGRETTIEDGKLVTKEVIKMYPDHRARMDAAKFAAEAQQAMPEKKQVMEVRTYEEKVAIIAEIKANPQEAMMRIQQLLESRRQEAASE